MKLSKDEIIRRVQALRSGTLKEIITPIIIKSISERLSVCNGNESAAARSLGMSRITLRKYRKIGRGD